MNPSEYQEQSAVVQWWASYCKTKGLDERLLVSIPNGSVLAGDSRARGIQMNRLKATGFRVGYPDLMLDLPMIGTLTANGESKDSPAHYVVSWPGVIFHGMRVEMKKKGAPKPSPEQTSYHELLRKQGYNVILAIGADEAIRAIRAYVERAAGRVGEARGIPVSEPGEALAK